MDVGGQFLFRIIAALVMAGITLFALPLVGVDIYALDQLRDAFQLVFFGLVAVWFVALPWFLRLISPRGGGGIVRRIIRAALLTIVTAFALELSPYRTLLDHEVAPYAIPGGWFLLLTFLELASRPRARATGPKPVKPQPAPVTALFRPTRVDTRPAKMPLAAYVERLSPGIAQLVTEGLRGTDERQRPRPVPLPATLPEEPQTEPEYVDPKEFRL
jgi:hypothetical protein